MSDLQYTVRPNSVTMIDSDGEIHNVAKGQHNFDILRDAIVADMQEEDPDKKLTETRFFELLHYRAHNPLTMLNGRVSYDEDKDILLFDGDPINTDLAEYIRELVKSNSPQIDAFVNFLVRLHANPSQASRESLFHWIKSLLDLGEKLTITPEGMLVAYKGVLIDDDGDPASINSGPGYVNGEFQEGHLKNTVGSVVSVSRSYVDSNRARGCSRGLHAGTYSYAHGFARGMTLRVEIDPVDVVSVPSDCGFQKIRCCRYTVIEVNDAPETAPVVRGMSAGWDAEDFECWEDEGYDFEDADRYNSRGFTLDQAFDIEADGGLDAYDAANNDEDGGPTMDDWLDLAFTLPQVLRLQKAGVTFDEAAGDAFDPAILEEDAVADKSDEDAEKIRKAKKKAKKAKKKAKEAKKKSEEAKDALRF